MSDRISFTDPVQHRLNANGWARGLSELQQLNVDIASQEPGIPHHGQTIRIDLSKAVFADFAILGRILILAVALANRGIDLLVRMPDDKISPDEQKMLIASEREIARNARFGLIARLCRQRENCRLFLHQSGFSDALRTGPLTGKVRFDEDDEGLPLGEGNATPGTFDPSFQERYHPPQRLRRVVPYRWLEAKNGGQDSQLPDLSGIEQSLDKMGLTSYDATAITQGILREAIENVAYHSGATGSAYALLGAILVQPATYKPRLQDFDGYLETFTKWASGVDSPLLRLIVGDAGRGIQPAIDSARPPDAMAVEQAIIAALDYHPPSPDSTTGPHGLWKVKEMVRSFQGSVVTISGPAIAGYVFEPNEHEVRSSPSSPYWLPGTIVEFNLLAGAEREPEPVAGGGSPPEASSPRDIRCVSALLRSGMGLDPDDITEIADTLLESDEDPRAGVVISVEMRPGDASPTDGDIQQAIHQIHNRAKYAITDAMIAVVFTGVSWRLLELAVIDLNLQLGIEERSDGTSLVTSMLIMTADGRHYWVGGSPNFRKVFQQLSHNGSPLRLTAVSKLLGPAEARQLVEAGQSLRRILTVESGIVRLRFQPHHAISALTDHYRHHLAIVATEQRSYGKDGEVFVAPSLREVDRWIDIRGALHTAKCTRIAGFLMAAGAQALIAAPSGSIPEIRVVRVGSLEEELASTFVLSLTGNEREVSFEELETLQNVRPDAPRGVVVLCTGIVSNGAAIRRTIRELWHLGFPDVAVAAIIDARDLTRMIDHIFEDADNLVVYGKKVPFFSLATVSVTTKAETDGRPNDRIFIDPLICQPVPVNYPRAKNFMLQTHYKDAIRRSDACRLGHIRRSGRRHYPAYIDTAKLFADADWSRQVIAAVMKRIEHDHSDARLGQTDEKSPVCIIYPGEPNEDLAYVAQRLLGAMRAGTISKQRMASLDPIPVPRAIANGEWCFPRAIQLPKNARHIVAIDSLSKTGTTLRHLIRLAAQPQVKFISAFSLVNGMTDLEALALQEIASVRARSLDDNGKRSETIVPVNVRYLVRTAAGSTDDASCAQCALRASYASLPPMPELLERHRDWLLRMLGTRSRESVYADTLSDLFGMAVKQDDCIEYLVWRSFLAEATVDTESRLKVVDKISELAECRSDDLDDDQLRRRDALVRVLAAELDRLPAAPLFFTSVRAKVMKILWSLVEAPRTYAMDQALRVQAVVVLSRGDVQGFSAEYARLVRDSSDNELVLRQVLIEAVRLITRRSGLPDWSNTLANQISLLSQEVHMLPESGGSSWARPELAEDLDYLAALMEDERGTAF